MAGPIPQTPVQFWNGVSVLATNTEVYELDTGQCYGCWIIVNIDLDALATNGATLRVYPKTDTDANLGTRAEKPLFSVELDDDSDGISFLLDPGTYSIELTNNDSTYALTVNAWKRLLA